MPWYLKKRVWVSSLVLLFLYLFYATQVPTPPRYNVRTTGIEEPLFYKGQVDYFAEFEKRYNTKLHPAADNGFRDVLIACGPRILEQSALMDAVEWHLLPVDPHTGGRYWQNRWLPLCGQLEIDPLPRPKYLDSLHFEFYFSKLKKEYERQQSFLPPPDPSQPSPELPDHLKIEAHKFREEIARIPFDVSENPEIEKWLAQRNPMLDLFNDSIRKPNYFCPRFRPVDDGAGLWCVLLPDVQAQREFARDLQVRISDRVFRGDLEGAWHDTMSMYLLSRRHYQYEPFCVIQLVGLAVEGMGHESLQLILQHGKPTKELLEKIAEDLDSLPPFEYCFGELAFNQLAMHESMKRRLLWNDNGARKGILLDMRSLLRNLPMDQNIAGERLTQLFEQSGMTELANEKYHPKSSEERKHLDEKTDAYEQFIMSFQLRRGSGSLLDFLPLLTIQSRSRFAADIVWGDSATRLQSIVTAFDRAQEQFDSARAEVEEIKRSAAT